MSKGDVTSEDLFPEPKFYEATKAAPPPKLPSEEIGNVLSLKDGEIGVIIITKRAEGGFVAVSDVVKVAPRQKAIINLVWARLKKRFYKESQKFG